MTTPDAPHEAAPPAVDPKSAATKPTKKKHRLIRPRGKRGGAHNRKKTSSTSTPGKPGKAGDTSKPNKSSKNSKSGPNNNENAQLTSSEPASQLSSAHAQKIAEYHTLQKRLAQAKAALNRPGEAVQAQLQVSDLEAQLADLSAYQQQSLTGEVRFNAGQTSKWLVTAFGAEWKKYQEQHGKRRARLLDVGALSGTAYKKYGWIDATYIDLNPQGDKVQQADFFTFPPPSGSASEPKYDIVSLSLVLNFVGDLFDRGEMLLRSHKFLTPRGYLYVVLPLACVTNSRYLDHDTFHSMVSHAGYDVVQHSDSNKLARWLLRRKDVSSQDGKEEAKWDGSYFKKNEIRVGPSYNNFCIRLGKPLGAKEGRAQEDLPKAVGGPDGDGSEGSDAEDSEGDDDDEQDDREGTDTDADDDDEDDDPVLSD